MIYVGVKDRWWEKRKKLLFHETNTSRVNFRITRWLLHYSTSCGCHGIKIIELPQELKAIDRTQYYGYSKTVITSVSRGHDGPRSVFLPPGFIFMKENDSKSSGIPGIIFWGKTTTNHGHDTCIPTSHLRPVQCLLEWFWVPTLNMHVPGVKSIHCLAHLRWWAHMTATNGGIGTRRMGKSPPPPRLTMHSLYTLYTHVTCTPWHIEGRADVLSRGGTSFYATVRSPTRNPKNLLAGGYRSPIATTVHSIFLIQISRNHNSSTSRMLWYTCYCLEVDVFGRAWFSSDSVCSVWFTPIS
jgi:hypothetical protein